MSPFGKVAVVLIAVDVLVTVALRLRIRYYRWQIRRLDDGDPLQPLNAPDAT